MYFTATLDTLGILSMHPKLSNMTIEFIPWPKISRWNRDITITEKIDGTNGAIGIKLLSVAGLIDEGNGMPPGAVLVNGLIYQVYAQSRNRIVVIGDNHFGFAQWVNDYRYELVETLGEGIHFGEWWGSKIGRGYNCEKGERYFSLFNTSRWNKENTFGVPGLTVTPIIYEGMMNHYMIEIAMDSLRRHGSRARPGFMKPEGIVIFHSASNVMFKITLENDEVPKGLVK